jgi:hypothetical protein
MGKKNRRAITKLARKLFARRWAEKQWEKALENLKYILGDKFIDFGKYVKNKLKEEGALP